jgi:hypothetical protein
LARGERSADVALSPRVSQLVSRDLGAAGGQPLHLGHADPLSASPGRELVDLGRKLFRVFPHDVDERATRLRVRLDASVGELSSDPLGQPPLRHVEHEDLACLRTRLGERRALLRLLADEHEDGIGRGRSQVGGNRLHIRRLPPVDVGNYHQPLSASEQPRRVAGSNGILAAHVEGREELRRLVSDSIPQASNRTLDLRTVAADDQVEGFELGRHRGQA